MSYIRVLASIATLLLVSGCGGGGASFGGGIVGSGKQGVRVGALESDGAVVVDGITFDAGDAMVTVSGENTAVADLRQGMVAVVSGLIDGVVGTASSVQIEEVIKGVVQTKVDATTMVVLGQTVAITPSTVFGAGISPASLDGLIVGDFVEVYGFLKSVGVVSAARVERKESLSEFRVVGIVANLDATGETFDIGAQGVDYATADTTNLPGGEPANGQIVEVRGPPGLNSNNEIVASRVKLVDDGSSGSADDVEVEGFITSVTSATEFTVGTQRVRTSGATVFERGTSADIVVGAGVEIEGSLDSGLLLATKVQFGEVVKLESDVATVNGNEITLVGMPGLTVMVTGATQYEGDANSLGDVVQGDYIKVRGRVAGAAMVTATRVEEDSGGTDVELQAPVDASPAPSDPTLSILGVSVDTTSVSNNNFEGANGAVIGRSGFFVAATPGTLVKISGTLSGAVITWDEAEVANEGS